MMQATCMMSYLRIVPRSMKRTICVAKIFYFPSLDGDEVLQLWSPANWVSVLPKDRDDGRWFSVQFTGVYGRAYIFQVKHDATSCRSLTPFQFHVITRAPMKQKREYPALCNMAEKFIFVSGGWNLGTVERYDLNRDVW